MGVIVELWVVVICFNYKRVDRNEPLDVLCYTGYFIYLFCGAFHRKCIGIAMHPIFAHNNSKTTKCGQ